MNNDLPSIHSPDNSTQSRLSKNLDERFADHPLVYQRLQQISDQMDQALEQGFTGDQAEEMTIELTRKLGADMLTDWTQIRSAQSLEQALRQQPQAIKDEKNKRLANNLRHNPPHRTGAEPEPPAYAGRWEKRACARD